MGAFLCSIEIILQEPPQRSDELRLSRWFELVRICDGLRRRWGRGDCRSDAGVIDDALRELRHSRHIHQLQGRDDDPELLFQTQLQLYQHLKSPCPDRRMRGRDPGAVRALRWMEDP